MARKRKTMPSSEPPSDRGQVLLRRARRFALRGEHRKAAVALRELVTYSGDARSWTLLGDMLVRARRKAEAIAAFRQAMWLHNRSGSKLRARTVARLIVSLDPHDEKAVQLAGC
jgi:Flp pilus assembly protein TadD